MRRPIKKFPLIQQASVYSDEEMLRSQLIWKIFSENCSSYAEELAEEFFVSVPTIHRLLRQINEILMPYQLHLVKHKKFYQVEGSEFTRRVFLNTMVLTDARNTAVTDHNFFDKINLTDLRSAIFIEQIKLFF